VSIAQRVVKENQDFSVSKSLAGKHFIQSFQLRRVYESRGQRVGPAGIDGHKGKIIRG